MRARHRATPYLLIAPRLLVFGGIVLVPIGLTAGFSFFRWDGLGPFEAVGLLNYRRAIQDEIFRSSFVHAAIYIGLTIVLEVLVGMALAGLLTAHPKRRHVLPRRLLRAGDAADGGHRRAVGVRLQPRHRAAQRRPARASGSTR